MANDVFRLGGAVANAGQAQMIWARQNAESQARAEYSSIYMKGMEEDRTRILQTTGSESFESQKMMEEAIRKRSEASQKNLQNPLARSVFDGMRQDFDRQNMVVSDRHAATQRKAYDTTTREAMKTSLIAESAMDGGNAFAGNIQKIKAENDAIYAGQPREYIDLQNQKDAMLAVKARAEHLGRENPAAALDFLNSGVEAEIGDGAALKLDFDALRTTYGKAQVEAEQKEIVNKGTSKAIGMVRAGANPSDIYMMLVDEVGKDIADQVIAGVKTYTGLAETEQKEDDASEEEERKIRADRFDDSLMNAAISQGRTAGSGDASMQAIRDEAYANFPMKYAKTVIETAEAERKAISADEAAKAVDRTKTLDQEFEEAGRVAGRMASYGKPISQGGMTSAEMEKYSGLNPKSAVSISQYLSYQKMTDDQLLAVFSDQARLEQAEKDLGGVNSKWFTNVFDRIDPAKRDKNGSGGSSSKAKFLDSDLDTIRRAARMSVRESGRDLSREELDDLVDIALDEADAEIMKRIEAAGVGSYDELPLKDRQAIYDELMVTYQSPGWSSTKMTRAEARASNADTEDWTIDPKTLPPEVRANYVTGDVEERNGMTLNVDIPYLSLSENIRTAKLANPGTVDRIMSPGESQGCYVLVPFNQDKPVYVFDPSGTTAVTVPRKADEAIPDADDPEIQRAIERTHSAGGIGL